MTRRIGLVVGLLVLLLSAPAMTMAQTKGRGTVTNGYAPVNGLKMYYEIHGEGMPLVLLHGGVGGITMFGENVEALAKGRKVIAVELQGHGHTADVDRPLTFEGMADDVAALVTYLKLGQVDVMGYSLGGDVAEQMAIRHPEMVRKLVVVSGTFAQNGMFPEVLAQVATMGPGAAEMMKQSPLSTMYPGVNWGTLFAKLSTLLSTPYDWSKGVAGIKSPTLLVFADADSVRPAHMMEFYALLGGGQKDAGQDGSGRPVNQLAVLPGLTHYSLGAAPALAAAVVPFLDVK